ncbi:unnamed protein product, partial [Polarella glacialis]
DGPASPPRQRRDSAAPRKPTSSPRLASQDTKCRLRGGRFESQEVTSANEGGLVDESGEIDLEELRRAEAFVGRRALLSSSLVL